MSKDKSVLCPSAQPDWEGSQVIGVIGGDAVEPSLAYLKAPQTVTEELLKQTEPVSPGEVFRFSAPCACSGCGHFDDEQSKCKLAQKIVRLTPVVVDELPACSIRPDCRWWQQEGKAACIRCPQVVTNNLNPAEGLRLAVDLEVE